MAEEAGTVASGSAVDLSIRRRGNTMSDQTAAKKKEPESVVAMKEPLKVERQIVKTSAVLDELLKKKSELLAKMGG
jgi:hypothetical protein